MGFTLNLTFRGLCALIPNEPLQFDGQQSIADLKVLIPEARQEQPRGPLTICAHDPKITFDQPTGPDLTWALDGELIELSLGDAPPAGITIEASMEKVPRLRKAAPGSGPVRQDVLQQLAASDLLVASLSLSSGSLQGIEPSPIPLEFFPRLEGSEVYQGQFARAVRALIPVAGDRAVLRTRPTLTGTAREAVLRPKPGRSSVDMTISNLCGESQESGPLDVDADFRLYYDLLESFAGPLFPLPTPVIGQSLGEVRGEATRAGLGCVNAVID